ncbi:VF530 family protein [Paraglaciecola aquimarina]|uniref:VF530 family protein n=1 Tax=Paraglaciecola algarum TaxID=3050085 RepID=A0ABS9D5W9_9ALTE|nr:VF530 family protein [Paraglaciecola sp. G1-23]MCF2948175.1 VF530 family protein [Paraglaciecola sp. G1-23]
MHQSEKNDPLHGVTLQQIVEFLEGKLGWEALGEKVKINCFTKDPSIKSSLKFLRKTPWAREKVEQLYISESQVQPNQSEPGEKFVWPDIKK